MGIPLELLVSKYSHTKYLGAAFNNLLYLPLSVHIVQHVCSYFISIAMQKICVNFTFAVYNILRIVKLALPCHISNLGHTPGKKGQHSWPTSKIQGKHPIQLSNLYEDGQLQYSTDFEYRLSHKKVKKMTRKTKQIIGNFDKSGFAHSACRFPCCHFNDF